MTKDMILHTMTKKLVRNWRTRVLSAAHSSSLTGALTQRQNLCADEITARASRDYGSCSTSYVSLYHAPDDDIMKRQCVGTRRFLVYSQ